MDRQQVIMSMWHTMYKKLLKKYLQDTIPTSILIDHAQYYYNKVLTELIEIETEYKPANARLIEKTTRLNRAREDYNRASADFETARKDYKDLFTEYQTLKENVLITEDKDMLSPQVKINNVQCGKLYALIVQKAATIGNISQELAGLKQAICMFDALVDEEYNDFQPIEQEYLAKKEVFDRIQQECKRFCMVHHMLNR